MLRNILESTVGPIADAEYQEVLDLVRTDIKVNRVAFRKRTSLEDAVQITLGCYVALQRGKAA